MSDPTPSDAVQAVDAAWSELEQSIHRLGEHVRNASAGPDARQRYEAYCGALALIADNYVSQVYAEPTRPEFLPYIGLVANYAGPAPDFNYFLVRLRPGVSYRVTGTRGDAAIIDVQQIRGWFGRDTDQRSVVTLANQTFDSQNIPCDASGQFDFVMGPEGPSNGSPWWRLEHGVTTLVFREIFTDYARQGESLILHFQALGEPAPERAWSLEESLERLRSLGRSMTQYGFVFGIGRSFAALGNNVFRRENFGDAAGASDQAYIQARFELPPGFALLGSWTVPARSQYWSFSLYTDQYQVFDFADHQVGLNQAQADVGADGVFHFVLSDEDPGVANWLDADGHQTGMLLLRAKNAPGCEAPSMKLVALADLAATLPSGIRMCDGAQRAEALEVRRSHYLRRSRR